MPSVLYVYAMTRRCATPGVEGVDQSRNFGCVEAGGITAVHSRVDQEQFSQEAVDRRASDLEWLGAIGYRHQGVVSDIMKSTAVVPLRAFTLFSSEESLRRYIEENRETLARTLDRLDGKQEWTLRIEFDPERWMEALSTRVPALRDLEKEIAAAASGKGFLLKKKLADERKRASRAAEEQVVSEIERAVLDKLQCETVAETRQQRDGAFPQINVLLNRDEETVLIELHQNLNDRYSGEGVALSVSGPWPPYTFAHA
jgi:hypothetical protein